MVIIYILYIIYYLYYNKNKILYYKLKIEMAIAQMKLNFHKECCFYF